MRSSPPPAQAATPKTARLQGPVLVQHLRSAAGLARFPGTAMEMKLKILAISAAALCTALVSLFLLWLRRKRRSRYLRHSDERRGSGSEMKAVGLGDVEGGAPRKRLIIFDFDLTLTVEHTSGAQDKSMLTSRYIRRNLRDPKFLRRFLTDAHSAGHVVCIASFADKAFKTEQQQIAGEDLVTRYLSEVVPEKDLQRLVHSMQCWYPATRGLNPDEVGKNKHIATLVASCKDDGRGEFGRSDVILIDDDAFNVELARKEGYHAFVCKDGFTKHFYHSTQELGHLLQLPY
eukprot:Sspe_Gene.109192::Locus_88722_Transcript_1_1_Confidence_1.000_Length_1207::g.109192::m.109192